MSSRSATVTRDVAEDGWPLFSDLAAGNALRALAVKKVVGGGDELTIDLEGKRREVVAFFHVETSGAEREAILRRNRVG